MFIYITWNKGRTSLTHALEGPHSQNSKISFGYVDFYAKSFLILYPSLENSTTPIAIPFNNKNKNLENWNSNIWRVRCREQVIHFATSQKSIHKSLITEYRIKHKKLIELNITEAFFINCNYLGFSLSSTKSSMIDWHDDFWLKLVRF